jgi:hypothetical protein
MLPGRMEMLWRRAQARSVGQKVQQLGVAGCVEVATDECEQQKDLG